MEDSLGAFSLTCTHKNQWGFMKMRFLTQAAIYPMHLVLDPEKAGGGAGGGTGENRALTKSGKCGTGFAAVEK